MRHEVGERIGKLTLLKPIKAGEAPKDHSWLCRCDCGEEIIVITSNLRRQTKCKQCAIEENTKHGMSDTPLYTVCNEWLDFEPFMKWSLKNGYEPSLTLDRIDNDKGYSPANCRWADKKTQQNNRRNSIYITANGVTLPCAEWARRTGIPKNTLRARYVVMGWSGDRTVNTPVAKR